MKFKTLTPTFVLLVTVVVLTLALSTGAASVSASSGRNRALHVTRRSAPNILVPPVGICTITSSNLGRIKVGSRVYYDQPAGIPAGLLDSNVVLDAGNGNRAVGRCTLDMTTGLGLSTVTSTERVGSPGSMPVSRSRRRLQREKTGAGKGRTASIRSTEPKSFCPSTTRGRYARQSGRGQAFDARPV